MSAFPFDKYDEMTKDERVPMSTSTADEHALEDETQTATETSTLGSDEDGVQSTEQSESTASQGEE